jgi:copper chaperone CopZ
LPFFHRINSHARAWLPARRVRYNTRQHELDENSHQRRDLKRTASDAFKEGGERMKAEFHIQGMHCDSCAALIKETLEETAGVQRADVTFGGKTAVVDFDNNVVQQTTLIKKIQDVGYTATVGDQQQGATNNG